MACGRFREASLTDVPVDSQAEARAQRLTLLLLCRFKEVFMTDTHLCIVMEYAQGGHLSSRISTNGKLPEAEARRSVPPPPPPLAPLPAAVQLSWVFAEPSWLDVPRVGSECEKDELQSTEHLVRTGHPLLP